MLKICYNKLKFEAETPMVDFRLIGSPIVLDSFYRAEPFAAHFISQVVDDIVDTVHKGTTSARVMAIVNFRAECLCILELKHSKNYWVEIRPQKDHFWHH